MSKKRTITYEQEFSTHTGMKLAELQQIVEDVVDDFAKSTEQPMVRIAALYPGPQSESYVGTLRLVVTTEES